MSVISNSTFLSPLEMFSLVLVPAAKAFLLPSLPVTLKSDSFVSVFSFRSSSPSASVLSRRDTLPPVIYAVLASCVIFRFCTPFMAFSPVMMLAAVLSETDVVFFI